MAGPMNSMEAVLAEYTAQLALTKRASSSELEGESTHPTQDAEDGTTPAEEGERSAENDSDVKENIVANTVEAPEATTEDAAGNVSYVGAPVVENEDGVPPVGNTQDDPGTSATELDVSTEKTAAEQKRIAALVKAKGRGVAANELAKQAMADLDALLKAKPAQHAKPAKRAAAEAGAKAAGYDVEVLNAVKQAAAEADAAGTEMGKLYAQFYLNMKKRAAAVGRQRRVILTKKANGEISPEEAEALLASLEQGGELGGGEGGEAPVELEDAPAAPEEALLEEDAPAEGDGGEGELPPEDLAALMQMAQGGEGGEGGDAGMEPEEGAMAVSDALDNLDLTPEQLMALEAALQEEGGASPEAQTEELGKVAKVLQQVGTIRNFDRLGRLNKRASASRTALTAQIQKEILQKIAYVSEKYKARARAPKAPVAK